MTLPTRFSPLIFQSHPSALYPCCVSSFWQAVLAVFFGGWGVKTQEQWYSIPWLAVAVQTERKKEERILQGTSFLASWHTVSHDRVGGFSSRLEDPRGGSWSGGGEDGGGGVQWPAVKAICLLQAGNTGESLTVVKRAHRQAGRAADGRIKANRDEVRRLFIWWKAALEQPNTEGSTRKICPATSSVSSVRD